MAVSVSAHVVILCFIGLPHVHPVSLVLFASSTQLWVDISVITFNFEQSQFSSKGTVCSKMHAILAAPELVVIAAAQKQ